MIKLAIVTNIRSPYRKLQIEEFSKENTYKIKVYYTSSGYEDRNWNVKPINGVEEVHLRKLLSFGKYGFLNLGLFEIVRDNNIILIGGYEMPSYIILNLMCKLYRRNSILIFDGISIDKINPGKFSLLEIFKRFIIKKFDYYFANGRVSKKYFIENYCVNKEKIYNQFLTVDVSTIKKHIMTKEDKIKYRFENNIPPNEKVIIYSGRLVGIKRVDLIIEAISLLDKKHDYRLIILGDGVERDKLLSLAKDKNVKITIMGFTADQDELFQRYNIGDALILPSDTESWGLVVNEAMAAGLPVIVSDNCGCRLDLVNEGMNGYIFKKGDEVDLSYKIKMLFECDYKMMGKMSSEMIKKWTFSNSKKNLEEIIKSIQYRVEKEV